MNKRQRRLNRLQRQDKLRCIMPFCQQVATVVRKAPSGATVRMCDDHWQEFLISLKEK